MDDSSEIFCQPYVVLISKREMFFFSRPHIFLQGKSVSISGRIKKKHSNT